MAEKEEIKTTRLGLFFKKTLLHRNVTQAQPGAILDIWKAKNLNTSLTSTELAEEMRKSVPSLFDDLKDYGLDIENNVRHYKYFKKKYLAPIKEFDYPADWRKDGRKILEKRKPPIHLIRIHTDDTSNANKFRFNVEKLLSSSNFLQLPGDVLEEIRARVDSFKTEYNGTDSHNVIANVKWQKTQVMAMGIVQFLIFTRKLSSEEIRSCISALPFDLHVSLGINETEFTDKNNTAYKGYDSKLKQTLKRMRSSLKPTPGKLYPFTTDFLTAMPDAQKEFHLCCKYIDWDILERDFDDMPYDHMDPIKKHYPNNGSSGNVSASPAAAGNAGTGTSPTGTTGKESSGTTSNATNSDAQSEHTNSSSSSNKQQQKFDSDSNENDSRGGSDTDDLWSERGLRTLESAAVPELVDLVDSSEESSTRSHRKHLRRGGDCHSTANASDISSLNGSENEFVFDDDESVPKRNAKCCASEFCNMSENGVCNKCARASTVSDDDNVDENDAPGKVPKSKAKDPSSPEYLEELLQGPPKLDDDISINTEGGLAEIQTYGARETLRFHPRLKNNTRVVLEAVKEDGLALEYASPQLQNNKVVVLEAIKQNGLALEYASSELQNDPDIVAHAVRQNALALAHVAPEHKCPDFVALAVKQNPRAIKKETFSSKRTLMMVLNQDFYETIETLTETNDRLSSGLIKQGSVIVDKDNRIVALEAVIVEKEADHAKEINIIGSKLDQKLQAVADLEDTNASHKADIEKQATKHAEGMEVLRKQLETTKKEATNVISQLNNKIDGIAANAKEWELGAIELANVVQKTNKDNELLESNLVSEQNEHRTNLARMTDTIDDLQQQYSTLQEENGSFQIHAIEHEQEIIRLRVVVDDRDSSIRQCNDANELLESSLAAEKKEHRADLVRLTNKIDDWQQQHSILQEENGSFRIAAIGHEQEMDRLRVVIDDRDSSIRQRNADLLASQAIITGLEETINELQTNLDNKQRFMDQQLQQLLDQKRNRI